MRDSNAALCTLDSMPSHGVAKTTAACNAAMAACERAGQWEAALRVLGDMEAKGPAPDSVTVRCAIFACCSANPGPPRVAEAKAIFKRSAALSCSSAFNRHHRCNHLEIRIQGFV